MKNKYSIFSLIKNAFSYHENWEKTWKDPEPKKEYDAVIVGGGGHGLSTLEHVCLQTFPQSTPISPKSQSSTPFEQCHGILLHMYQKLEMEGVLCTNLASL